MVMLIADIDTCPVCDRDRTYVIITVSGRRIRAYACGHREVVEERDSDADFLDYARSLGAVVTLLEPVAA